MNSHTNLVNATNSSTTEEPSDLIMQVIAEASKTFVAGTINNKNIKREAKSNASLLTNMRTEEYYLSYNDQCFAGDANWIPATSLIASKGPKLAEMDIFIHDVLNNNVQHIVALGACTAYDDDTYQDFHDYCLKERNAVYGPYEIAIKRIKGITNSSVWGHQCYPDGLVESQLEINRDGRSKELINVTVLGLYDNDSINLSKITKYPLKTYDLLTNMNYILKDLHNEMKETLWQLYQKSLNAPLLIHCASGVGRTGHLILTFQILKNYSRIFASQDPKMIAAKIHEELKYMRHVRVALVNTEVQFASAILNADILYHYALEKKYIQADIKSAQIEVPKVNVSQISLFSSSKIEKKTDADVQNTVSTSVSSFNV